FDMPDVVADGVRRPLQRADLVNYHLFDVFRLLALDLAPAKSPDIEKARMRADPDTVLLGPLHRFEHDQRVAAVKAAGDVGRGNDLQHLAVAAHRPGAKALAHVAVEVDHVHRGHLPVLSPLYMGGICIWEELPLRVRLPLGSGWRWIFVSKSMSLMMNRRAATDFGENSLSGETLDAFEARILRVNSLRVFECPFAG